MITLQTTSLIIGFLFGFVVGVCITLYGMFKDNGVYCKGFFDGYNSQREHEIKKKVSECKEVKDVE